MSIDDLVENAQEKQRISINLALEKGFPSEIKYFCWIHGRHEVAKCKGYWEFEDEEGFAMYNTPDGYTLNFDFVMQMSTGTLPLEEWKRYGYKEL